jgi:hypothetical protein
MPQITRTSLLALLLIGTGCSQGVTVPPAANDAPPVITVNAFVVQQPSGYSGDVEPNKNNVTATTAVGVTQGAQVQFSGSAKNPGGVKTFGLTIVQGGTIRYQVTTSSTPDANGRVPDLLSIVGTNGAGASGSQPMVVVMSSPVVVTATATNFNAMTQTITVTYNPVASNVTGGTGPGTTPPAPSTASLFATASHVLGPFQSQTAPPDFCQATTTWSLAPQSLTGTTGTATSMTQTTTTTPMPSWTFDAKSGLWSATCAYAFMFANLRTGTWTVSAAGAPGTSHTPDWQAQCQAMLQVGMNNRRFTWGSQGCQ